jgi:hypothetical protein
MRPWIDAGAKARGATRGGIPKWGALPGEGEGGAVTGPDIEARSLTGWPTAWQGLRVLLIVMFEANTWRVRPGERFTFGRAKVCNAVLPDDDRGVSRNAGSIEWRAGSWWLTNASASSMLYLSGDLGFRADIPPGMAIPLQQWHAKVRIDGLLDSYTLRMRLPDLDDGDRLVLAARFEEYLTWRHSGPAAPRSARETAERIGWQPHTVSKRCENIRNRYVRIGVPGLRGPRALEELAALLISTGELTTDDLRRLPPPDPSASPPVS